MLGHVQCMTQFIADPMPIVGSRSVGLEAASEVLVVASQVVKDRVCASRDKPFRRDAATRMVMTKIMMGCFSSGKTHFDVLPSLRQTCVDTSYALDPDPNLGLNF